MYHEYQIVWTEPNDGSHVFKIRLDPPFTDHTGPLPVADAHFLKIDWTHLMLGVFYPKNAAPLEAVTEVEDNSSTPAGAAGQGDYHVGVLKLPLVDTSEPPSQQADHYGIQEGDKEALMYSGVFIESIEYGVCAGWGKRINSIT